MKILFDHSSPFLLAHGGLQIQIEETKRALEKIDIGVDFVRWWDADQKGDIIHFFGRPSGSYIDLAHKKNIRVVMSELLTGLGSRSSAAIAVQRRVIALTRACFSRPAWAKMGWDAYQKADFVIALTEWERELMRRVFDARPNRLGVVPNGVGDEFFTAGAGENERGPFLVCAATITERKRVLELAQAAVYAETPLWVVGKPYAPNDSYAEKFFALVKHHPKIIHYNGPVEDRAALARIYRQARGFVLLSSMESLSLSALEAAACGCPLLLSDLPWARTVFKRNAAYCPIAAVDRTANALREFYDAAPRLQSQFKPLSWTEVAQQLKAIYVALPAASP